jgi:hypothetical protein
MPSEFQFDVFQSHSAKDKAVVRPLAERLRKDGLKVWFDEWVLDPGDSIPVLRRGWCIRRKLRVAASTWAQTVCALRLASVNMRGE